MLPLTAVLLTMTTSHPRLVYVALGDSTGVGVGARHGGGYPARLIDRARRRGEDVTLVNACVSGARAADVVADQLEALGRAHATVATLGIGINDVTRGTELAAFRRDYERIADALAASGARVLVVNVPDLSLSPLAQGEATRRALRERIGAVNELIAAEARRHGFVLVDLFSATEEELGRPGLLSEDQFHPSDAGYERWADLVEPVFEAALRASGSPYGASLSTGSPLR